MRVPKTAVVFFALLGCSGTGPHVDEPGSATRRSTALGGGRTHREARQAPALSSRELTVVPGGSFGPYIGRSGDASVLVWAAQDRSGEARWFSANARRSQANPPLELAAAPTELSLVAVRVAGLDNGSGFVVVAGEPRGEHAVVHALSLGDEGQLVGTPMELAETSGPLLWVDAVPTKGGPLVAWAVGTRGVAEIYAARLDGERTIHKVASDALAWQLAPFDRAAALGTISQNGALRDVNLRMLDERGQAKEQPLVLRTRSQAQLDFDLANIAGTLVAAWSEQANLEPALFAAAVDKNGQISQAAKRLTAPAGEQALVRVVPAAPSQKHGYVLWENLDQSHGSLRMLQVAPLLPNASLGAARATLQMHGEAATLPEFTASERGLLALSQAPMCLKPPKPCETSELFPTFVEFDTRLNVVASEPLRLTDTQGAPIDLAWGMGCQGKSCSALAAPKSGPAPVYTVNLEHKSDVFLPIASITDDQRRPRLSSNEALQELESLSDITSLQASAGELVAWVTYFDPTIPYERPKVAAPDGRFAPVRALLQTLHTGKAGAPPNMISLRARSSGGVAMAPGKDGSVLLGFTAIDRDVPQVFLTLANAEGQKKQLQMLTKTPGDVSEVALLRLQDGWAAGWVDERHQDPEVYLVKVANNLLPAAPERRITDARGDASELALLLLGDNVMLAWGDARSNTEGGAADVYTRLVSATDLTPKATEQAVSRSPAHSHSVQLTRLGQGAMLAWIDDAVQETPPALRLARFDASGNRVGELLSVDVGAESLSALALECTGDTCHAVVTGSSQGRATLWALVVTGKDTSSTPLTTFSGPPSQPLIPALTGNVVFVGVQSSEGQTRLRRLYVHWD